MPARTVRRIDHVPRDEWRPLCLECAWMGDEVFDEAACARQAYEHNLARHEGAGVEPQMADFLPADRDRRQNRRMFRIGALTALFVAVIGTYSAVQIDSGAWRAFFTAVNFLTAITNAFMAGKWARRLEDVTTLFPREAPGP